MYRVAIVQNEREMLRAGYVSFAPRLAFHPQLKNHSLSVFDASNIDELFGEGPNGLNKFDGLFVATNATSDSLVLAKLCSGKTAISAFLSSGKGVFVGSQKKLSVADGKPSAQGTGFLPDNLDFQTVERPRIEKDSGEGRISEAHDVTSNPALGLLLSFPIAVSANETQARCEINDFKRHIYRSHIVPTHVGMFHAVFEDRSYPEPAHRNLLMVNRAAHSGERLVATTIVLDWEFHENLLVNIIRYIAEGIPLVAFVDKPGVKAPDFDYIQSSARVAKIGHATYDNFDQIGLAMSDVHNTYVFSPGWEEEVVTAAWQKMRKAGSGMRRGRRFRRLYYFREIGGHDALTRYSNFSSIDLLIDRSLLWVEAEFVDGMWSGSFWTSYDVITMMLDLDIEVSSYLPSIFRDIRRHSEDGSYDGIMGATCGLVELKIALVASHAKIMEDTGTDTADIDRTWLWIHENFGKQSLYEAQTAFLTIARLERANLTPHQQEHLKLMQDQMKRSVRQLLEETELDISRKIAVCLLCGDLEDETERLLRLLASRQEPDGRWVSEKRTAFVLTLLLRDVVSVIPERLGRTLDDIIYSGVVFLRSCHDASVGNWDGDVQTTAKALHAIGLYNQLYGHSTQDFFESIRPESREVGASAVFQSASDALARMRISTDNAIQRATDAIVTSAATESQLRVVIEERDTALKYEKMAQGQAEFARYVGAISGSLFIGLIVSLLLYHFEVASALLSEIGSILAMIVSTVVGVVVALITRRPSRPDGMT